MKKIKELKKTAILLLALLLSMVMAGQALAFTDIDGCSPETRQAINELAEKQILNGYIDETFRPNDSISRAEFAKVATLALTAKTNSPLGAVQEISYRDVSPNAWYAKVVANAAALGLMKGDAEGTFRPNDTVSQAEVLTVLVRSLGYTEAELVGLPWPANYLAKAEEIGLLSVTSVFNPNAACTRGEAATYVARMLALPQAGAKPAEPAEQLSYDYGVVTELTGSSITISSFKSGARSYKLAADCDWQAAKSDCGVGRLVYFGVNADKTVVSVSRQDIYTHDKNEAELSGTKIKLNGKNLLLADDATVLLMNSSGGVSAVSLERLLASSYVADLRSNDYRAPLQYVLDGKNVRGLLIGDYRGQTQQQFGYVDEFGTGKDGEAVKFYGENEFYEWNYVGKDGEQSPETDVLYAYEHRADGVRAYRVDRNAEQIRGSYGEGEPVQFAGDICLTASGKQFIVDAETVIMKVSYRSDGTIYDVEYTDAVYGGDRVCVRYTEKHGSGYTGIEAAYILVLDFN